MAVKASPAVLPNSSKEVSADPRKIREAAALAVVDGDAAEFLPADIDPRFSRYGTRDQQALVNEICRLWQRTQEQFLEIGQSLIAAREMIETATDKSLMPRERRVYAEAEWSKFLAKLPFTQPIATQLERVARALDSGKLLPAELPSTYSAAYQLTTLSPDELDLARQQSDIVGPSATRARIVEFKRRLRETRVDGGIPILVRRKKLVIAIERLRVEQERLHTERERLCAELQRIDQDLSPEPVPDGEF
jgi:hypothetical protein